MKILKCSNNKKDQGKINKILSYVIIIIGIFFLFIDRSDTKYIRYTIAVIAIIFIIWYEFLYAEIPKLELNIEQLLDIYEKNPSEFYKKYNDKYIKLNCKVLDTQFIENAMVNFVLGENEQYSIEGKILLPTKKCINYFKKSKVEQITIYGDLSRNKDSFLIEIFYIEL